mmetsp:Transcript_24468/g.41996  ORF Transcript_24468/g.41996 Transcript_24468/m.41996 type:complete len:256 (-) Transcript_24468:103-870(-)
MQHPKTTKTRTCSFRRLFADCAISEFTLLLVLFRICTGSRVEEADLLSIFVGWGRQNSRRPITAVVRKSVHNCLKGIVLVKSFGQLLHAQELPQQHVLVRLQEVAGGICVALYKALVIVKGCDNCTQLFLPELLPSFLFPILEAVLEHPGESTWPFQRAGSLWIRDVLFHCVPQHSSAVQPKVVEKSMGLHKVVFFELGPVLTVLERHQGDTLWLVGGSTADQHMKRPQPLHLWALKVELQSIRGFETRVRLVFG